MADKIIISGIRFHGFHGLTALEKEIGVRFSIDLEMERDLLKASNSDALGNTIDYRRVHEIVLDIGRNESYRLLEKLAGRIASEILNQLEIDQVTVKVKKETPVLDGIVDFVGVELTRKRKKERKKL
jgi:dihydroneopterin aldolase